MNESETMTPRAVYANETPSAMGEDPRTRARPTPAKRSTDGRPRTKVRKTRTRAPRKKTDLHLEKNEKSYGDAAQRRFLIARTEIIPPFARRFVHA